MLLTPARIKPKLFESRQNSLFFFFFLLFLPGVDASHVYVRCLGARLLPQSYQYPNLSGGADCVAGQLRGDKECAFNGLTKSGRVWTKVPESEARSGGTCVCVFCVSVVGQTLFLNERIVGFVAGLFLGERAGWFWQHLIPRSVLCNGLYAPPWGPGT